MPQITLSPNARSANPSELWLLNVETEEKHRLTIPGDGAQPKWSPHGDRIAFWGQNQGAAKNIFTIRRDGGEPVPVPNDSFVNWNPLWSSDGSYLYFASDRGGSMNLWRVQIDEKSGNVLVAPLPQLRALGTSAFPETGDTWRMSVPPTPQT